MTQIFTTSVDADGVATLSWDLPGRSMNVMTFVGVEQLEAAVEALSEDEADRFLEAFDGALAATA